MEHEEGPHATLVLKERNPEDLEEGLDRGADIDAEDIYGKTPLHLAAEKGHTEIVNLLSEKKKKKIK